MLQIRIDRLGKQLSQSFMSEYAECREKFYRKFHNRMDGTRERYFRFESQENRYDESKVDIVDEIHAELFLVIHEMRRLMDFLVEEGSLNDDARTDLGDTLMNVYQPITKKVIRSFNIEERGVREVLHEHYTIKAPSYE